MVIAAGSLAALGMAIGALGPWVRTPVISVGGWAGLRFPLVLLALVALALQVPLLLVPRLGWPGARRSCVSLAAFAGSVLLMILVGLVSHFSGSLVSLLLARGGDKDAFGAHDPSGLRGGCRCSARARWCLPRYLSLA